LHPAIGQAIGAAPQVKGIFDALGGPGAMLGRFVGFGQNELRSGVPGWAWFLMGAGAGAVAMWFGKDQIDDYVRRAG
jgi:hypothetical protein